VCCQWRRKINKIGVFAGRMVDSRKSSRDKIKKKKKAPEKSLGTRPVKEEEKPL
jgi:hypothetical protein